MSTKKQIFKLNTLKKLLSDENSCVNLVPTTRLLALPPFFLNDMKSGILYLLNNMLKKYDRSLGGIVIGYQNIKVLMDENTGIIPIGTSETEVNISVEFYIFQPRIGSFLEGVINKKSNSHIGCLVHRYFNATILKPEDVNYDEWICQEFNVDDKIIFKVKDLDFTSLLPLIEGVIDDGRLLDRVKSDLNVTFNLSRDIVNNVNERCPSEVLFSNKIFENKKKIESVKVSTMKDNIDKNSFTESKNKKKKKKEKVKEKNKEKEKGKGKEKLLLNSSDDQSQRKKEEDLSNKVLIPDTLIKDFKADEGYCVKKKKKRSKNLQEEEEEEQVVKNTQGVSNEVISKSHNISEKSKLNECNKNINDFVKPCKVKKETKKRKTKAEESYSELNKTNQCFFSNEAEDEIFYSTQLDPSLPKRMKICCSPISKDTQSTKEKLNSNEEETQNMVEEIFKKQTEKIKEEFNKSDKDGSKERKRKKEKPHKEENEVPNLSKIKKSRINGGSGNEKNFDTNSLLDELRQKEIERVKRELTISGRENFKESKKAKVKIKKKENENFGVNIGKIALSSKKSKKSQINETHNNAEKLSVQDIIDQSPKQELNMVKVECRKPNSKSSKEEKRATEIANKQKESSKEKSHNPLFEKLLKEAKSAVGLEEGKFLKSPLGKDSGKKKKNISQKVTCSSKISESIEKSNR